MDVSRLTMMSKRRMTLHIQSRLTLTLLALFLIAAVARPEKPNTTPLLTVAERSDYRRLRAMRK